LFEEAGASQEPEVKQKLGSLMQVAAEGDQAEVRTLNPNHLS